MKRLLQGAAVAVLGAAAIAMPTPAMARTYYEITDVQGTYITLSSDADCYITGRVYDNAADSTGAGVRLWVEDGDSAYFDTYNVGGRGTYRIFSMRFATDAAVSVRAFKSDGARPYLFGKWTTVC